MILLEHLMQMIIADEYTIENNRKQNMGESYNYNSEEEDDEDDEYRNTSSNNGISDEAEETVSINSY